MLSLRADPVTGKVALELLELLPSARLGAMGTAVWIANSHRWLYERLFEHAATPDAETRLVERRQDADFIIYLEPPWPDADAPDKLRGFSFSDLLRTFVYSQSDFPIRWAPGAYASLPRSHGEPVFTGAFYVSHHHRESSSGFWDDLEQARELEPDILWSFVGTVENAAVRQDLIDLRDTRGLARDTKRFSDVVRWNWGSTHRDEARRAFSEYATELGRSQFVICPRGRGASSMRLFEALQAGRCPVIVSDDWLSPAGVEWATCSIQVPERLVTQIPTILRERERDAEKLGREARLVWERRFSPERQLETLVAMCTQIARPATRAMRARVMAEIPVTPFAARRAAWAGRRLVVSSAHRVRSVTREARLAIGDMQQDKRRS